MGISQGSMTIVISLDRSREFRGCFLCLPDMTICTLQIHARLLQSPLKIRNYSLSLSHLCFLMAFNLT